MHHIRQFAFWALLLFGGAWVVEYSTYTLTMSGAGRGVGFFFYRFVYSLYISDELPDDIAGIIVIEGQAPSRFQWDGSHSPEYEGVHITWDFQIGTGRRATTGACFINLSRNEIALGDDNFALNASGLRRLFDLDPSPANEDKLVAKLLSILSACQSGTLPRPRHHSYHFQENFIRGRLQHGAGGWAIRYPILVWVGIWFVLLLRSAFTTASRQASPSSKRESHSV